MSIFNIFNRKKSQQSEVVKYLIAGLGNIGSEYSETRHNIGFKAVEQLAADLDLEWKADRFGALAQGKFRGRGLYLLKPDTYMNLSGKAVNFWIKRLGITNGQLLVITDDLNLPLGKIRLKTQGSNGGHNGLRSIEAELGTTAYPRIRVGIGRDFPEGRQVDYVLGKWSDEEIALLPGILKELAEASKAFTFQDTGRIMSRLNGLDLSKLKDPEGEE